MCFETCSPTTSNPSALICSIASCAANSWVIFIVTTRPPSGVAAFEQLRMVV
ncbi:MAG TPA: hypothetical protein VHN14_18950 [Kofleriaceae bacterium]|nr:hypothetical protein [Kofleriaceae bacterium]